MNDKTLQVGIIGFGYAGKTFHAPLVRTTPGLRIAAVSSSDAARVHAALGPGVAVTGDPRALAVDPALDLVVVASPNATHYELAALALGAGKHVVVDKPFTPTLQEAGHLAALARDHGVLLSVFHNRRWDSSTLTAQKMIASGELGAIRHAAMHFDRFRPQVQARWKEDAAAAGGTWMDLGPHLLDEALLYFGAPGAIQLDLAQLRPGTQADDAFHARLRYAGGLRVDLHASMLTALPRPRLALYGTRGSYVKQSLDPQEANLKEGALPTGEDAAWGMDPERGSAAVEREGALEIIDVATENGAYPAYYRQVRDAILGRAPNPVPPGQAIMVMRLLEAGRLSDAQRREVELDEVTA